jgi:hypothetical protein
MCQFEFSGYQPLSHKNTSVRIVDQETMTRFLKKFNYAKIQALTADNIYTEDQVSDPFLEAVESTSKPQESLVINILAEKRTTEVTLSVSDSETRFLKTGEKILRRKQQKKQHSANMSSHTDLGTPSN